MLWSEYCFSSNTKTTCTNGSDGTVITSVSSWRVRFSLTFKRRKIYQYVFLLNYMLPWYTSRFSWMAMITFIFHSINVIYNIYWFVYVELSLHPWDNSYLVMWVILLISNWIRSANILLRIFALKLWKILVYSFVFL